MMLPNEILPRAPLLDDPSTRAVASISATRSSSPAGMEGARRTTYVASTSAGRLARARSRTAFPHSTSGAT